MELTCLSGSRVAYGKRSIWKNNLHFPIPAHLLSLSRFETSQKQKKMQAKFRDNYASRSNCCRLCSFCLMCDFCCLYHDLCQLCCLCSVCHLYCLCCLCRLCRLYLLCQLCRLCHGMSPVLFVSLVFLVSLLSHMSLV